MLRIADLRVAPPAVETPFTFPLDPFQQYACAAIAAEENVLVTAKTGSGKTLVGEFQIHHSLKKGKRVYYTTPIKSLSNQKFHDLKAQFPSVGIVTGDIQFCPQADVVVLTTEILRNLLFKRGGPTEGVGLTAGLSIENLDAVVFDEVHYINDPDRGKVWEECLMLLPREVRIVMLSATLNRPDRLASWVGEIKQVPCHLIVTSYRLVPLVHCFRTRNEVLMDANGNFDAGMYKSVLVMREDAMRKAEAHARAVRARDGDSISRGDARVHSFTHQMNGMVRRLQVEEMLPALFFVMSRRKCEEYAAKVEDTLIDSSEAAAIHNIARYHLHRYPYLATLPVYHELMRLMEKGIAYHHSGMLPVLREIVEILFGRGLLKLLFATETFAVGLNMPTKTVVFTSFTKPADGGHRMLRTDEYLQMAGRAGRRGKDTKGWVFYLPDREPSSLEDVRTMMTGSPPGLSSKMDFHYDTILSQALTGRSVVSDSFWKREMDEDISLREGALQSSPEVPHYKNDPAYADRWALETAVEELGNAARKKAQKALEKWKQEHNTQIWEDGYKAWLARRKIRMERARAERDIAELKEAPPPTVDYEDFLKRTAFLDSEGKLTKRGQMASEVHEANPLILTLAIEDRIFEKLSQDDLVISLAAFLEPPSSDEEEPFLDQVGLSIPAQSAMASLGYLASTLASKEKVASPRGYWELHTFWMPAVADWLNGTLPQEVQEGTFVRAMLKLCNIIDEATTLFTMAADTRMLDVIRDAKQRILKDMVRPESLYLGL